MSAALSLLCRVVRRRLGAGEALEEILKTYPRLSETEKQQVVLACQK